MPRTALRQALLGLVVILGVGTSAQGRIVGRILHAGFPLRAGLASTGGGDGYRLGHWMPVAVDLRLEQQAEFSGFLRLEQPDRDGDHNFCEVPVNLRADLGSTRTYWLHVIANPRHKHRRDSFAVHLLNNDRETVPVTLPDGSSSAQLLPDQPPQEIMTETRLILDISELPVVQLDRLGKHRELLRREFDVARLEAAGLPPLWQALEAVDYIVWDGPRADQIDSAQLRALIDWVHHGGTLVLGAGQRALGLSRSGLGKILPVTVTGQTATATLPTFVRALYGNRADASYPGSFPVAVAKAKPQATVLAHEEGVRSDLLVRQNIGRGKVVFVGATLRDVLAARSNPIYAVGSLLQIRFDQRDENAQRAYPMYRDLFASVHSVIDFQMSVGLYLTLAILFVIAYILVSTLGAWHWLKGKNWVKHSWTVFTILAAAASGVSIASVQFVQGFGRQLSQIAVIDANANAFAAQAYCQFGVKTGAHTRLDIWLPERFEEDAVVQRSACSLRTLGPPQDRDEVAFIAPERYRAYPALGVLENVPFRATVKQFEARWSGQLDGQVRSDIRVRRSLTAPKLGFTDDSWIENRLGTDLHNCIIIHCTQGLDELGDQRYSRSERIYVHPVGDLEDGRRIDHLYDRLYVDRNGEEISAKTLDNRTLRAAQNDWGKRYLQMPFGFGAQKEERLDIDDYEKVLLLLTTLDEFEPEQAGRGGGYQTELGRTHVRLLDRSRVLRPGILMLIGFSDQAPPEIRLCARPYDKDGGGRWSPLEPSTRRTMYRVLLPVQRMDQTQESE